MVYHLAAQPGLSNCIKPESYFLNNVFTTARLVEFCKKANELSFLIYASSSSVYGAEFLGNESEQTNPISFYGITKLLGENIIFKQPKNFDVCSLRLSSVFGPRERPDKLIPRLISSAYHGRPFSLFKGSLKQRRSFTYIDDVIDAMISTLTNKQSCSNQVINIAGSSSNSVKECIEIVQKVVGKNIIISEFPGRNGDPSILQPMIKKAQLLLNFNPTISLQSGIVKEVDWYTKNPSIF